MTVAAIRMLAKATAKHRRRCSLLTGRVAAPYVTSAATGIRADRTPLLSRSAPQGRRIDGHCERSGATPVPWRV